MIQTFFLSELYEAKKVLWLKKSKLRDNKNNKKEDKHEMKKTTIKTVYIK